jgi:tRNA-specific 2-thiouridylase
MSRNAGFIAVAMSGGVDSSVAAARLARSGNSVVGFTMLLSGSRVSQGMKTLDQAKAMADFIGIPHRVVDLKEMFEPAVVDYFCAEYSQGRTPNPCIRCNELIKFAALWRAAHKQGAEALATGHHARIERENEAGRFLLLKGKDPAKDQSYFLYRLSQNQLSAARFPVGDMTKHDVRRLALEWELPTAARPESQEICFIPDNDYIGFLSEHLPDFNRPGPIVDTQGKVLGTHPGIVHFTVGQRRGIGLAAPDPLYVLEIRAREHTIVVGPNEALYRRALLADQLNWVALPGLERPLKARARIRYKHKEAAATLVPLPGAKVSVEFERAQRAITPGQSVVFYEGDRVLGGGIIEAALK